MAALFSPECSTTCGATRFSRNGYEIGATANAPDGFLGHTAPEFYPAGGGPSWGGEASELVRRLYVYYGDRRAVTYGYATLKKYLDHLESHTEGDILRYFNPYQAGQYQQWYFLGDWTPPGSGRRQAWICF